MDTPAWVRPQAPAPAPYRSRKNRTLLYVALIFGALASAVSAYIIWHDRDSGALFMAHEPVLLVPHQLPLFPATVLDSKSLKLEPLTVEGQGAASIIGYAHGKDADYYLLTSDGKSSNVFVADHKNPKAGLSQRTHSSTLKLNLTYDAVSGMLAYAALTGSTSMVTIARAGTTTETVLTAGTNPQILKGGFAVVYEHDGKLYSVNTGNGNFTYSLTNVPKGGAYAVDPEAMRIALYDPAVNAIQYFAIKGMAGASAESVAPQGKLFGNRILYFAGKEAGQFITFEQGLLAPVANKYSNVTYIPGSGPYTAARASVYEH